MTHWVYMLLCNSKPNLTFYTGSTSNIEKRLQQHMTGKGARYTKSHKPLGLVFKQEFETLSEARKREAKIKKYSRVRKIVLSVLYLGGCKTGVFTESDSYGGKE